MVVRVFEFIDSMPVTISCKRSDKKILRLILNKERVFVNEELYFKEFVSKKC